MIDRVAILAGGLATRLRPITETIPKSLVDVAGKPFIAWQLSLLRARGMRHVVLCLGHLGEQVEAAVGDGTLWDLHVEYSYDGESLLGTGGALRRARAQLGEVFWVLYGDSYLDFDYRAAADYFRAAGGDALGLMTVFANDNRWDRSNVVFRGGNLIAYDKRHPSADMHYIDYGATILRAEALDGTPSQPYDLADLFHQLVARNCMIGYEVNRRFYEVGSPHGLKETVQYFQTLQTAPIPTNQCNVAG